LIVDEFILTGNFEKCRLLGEPRQVNEFQNLTMWDTRLTMKELITDVDSALRDCRAMDKLFCFCKCFPAIDFSALDFQVLFQVTDSKKHSIHLAAIRKICNHVRTHYGEQRKVKLLFLVPEEVVTEGEEWKYTQSFVFTGEVDGVTRKMRSKYAGLPEEAQLDLRNLEQWVICFKP
jgi:hypothetical protein